jgi:phage tail-like protein
MADSTTGGYYPPLSFYFKVEFPNISKNTNDSSFQSVSGLSVEFDVDSVKEGGENSFEHKLPVRTKSTDLVLKRGLLTNSEVIQWCRDAFENMIFQPTDVLVKLLNEKGEPLRTWNIVHAWPRKWMVSDFSSTDNAVVVETLELSYHYFKII